MPKVPALLAALEKNADSGWVLDGAAFLSFDAVELQGRPWAVTRSLRVEGALWAEWAFEARARLTKAEKERLVQGVLHTLYHALDQAGYGAQLVDERGAFTMTFQRPLPGVAAALDEWDRLARADLAGVLATRAVASMRKRAAARMRPISRVKAHRTAGELAASPALAGTVSVVGALLGEVAAARSIDASHTVSALEPRGGQALKTARSALASRGYERGDGRQWHREVEGRRLSAELAWLAGASFLPREG
jgi:hypothetical protein